MSKKIPYACSVWNGMEIVCICSSRHASCCVLLRHGGHYSRTIDTNESMDLWQMEGAFANG